MILAHQIDSDAAHLNDAQIYTASDNKTRIFRANSVDIVDPSPTTPSIMLHSGTAYVLDHQGSDDNEQVFRNLRLNLKPFDHNDEVKRKAKSIQTLARSSDPADTAERQWRESRGACALFMALLAVPLSRVRPRQGRFSTLLPLTLLFVIIFYGGNICRTLVANGAFPVTPGLWLIPLLMLTGLVILLIRDGTLRWKTHK